MAGHARWIPALLAAMVTSVASLATGEAGSAVDPHGLDAFHARSARAEDVVLSFRVGGGYGGFEVRELLLYGDGRAEERLFKYPWKKDQRPETRILFTDPARVDAVLRRVVESGLVGLDNDRLLALVQARYPTVVDLVPGVDCSSVDLAIRLFVRPSRGEPWSAVETHLRLECLWAYARLYPDVPEACALTDLHAELVALTRAGQLQ